MSVRFCAIGGTIFAVYVENGRAGEEGTSSEGVDLKEILRWVQGPADLLKGNDVFRWPFGTKAMARIDLCMIGKD